MKRTFICLFLFVSIFFNLKAGLKGMDLSYRHLDDRDYQIILTHFFDCTPEKRDSSQPCYIFTKESGGFFRKIDLLLASDKDTSVSQANVCNANRDRCLKIVRYVAVVSLPTMYGGYEIVWRSKLKLPALTNAETSTSQNILLSLFIPYLGRDAYNSSPEFISMPFKTICLNQEMNVHLNASDSEKDSIVYSFTLPYAYSYAYADAIQQSGSMPPTPPLPENGSPVAQSQPNVPNRPEEYPSFPFDRMVLKKTYSPENPIHAREFLLDTKSGLLKINTAEAGTYLLSFLATEYRKNNILSKHQVIYFINAEN